MPKDSAPRLTKNRTNIAHPKGAEINVRLLMIDSPNKMTRMHGIIAAMQPAKAIQPGMRLRIVSNGKAMSF